MNTDLVPQSDRPREQASEDSILFAVLRAQSPGTYVELAPSGAAPSRLVHAFAAAGWGGLQLAPAEDTDIDALLAGLAAPQWMAVRGNAALRAIERWSGAVRPMVLVVENSSAPGAAAPAWRGTLAHRGYLFAIHHDGHDHFVRADQVPLLEQLAEHASLAWHIRWRSSQGMLAQALRDGEQARSALLVAKADGMAANARVTMLQQQIEAIHASASWKITKPLRWAARLRREPGPALRQLRTVARARLLALAGKALGRVATRINGNPALRARTAALAARHPALRRQVHALLRLGAAAPDAAESALPSAVDASNVVGPHFKDLLLDELGRPGAGDQ